MYFACGSSCDVTKTRRVFITGGLAKVSYIWRSVPIGGIFIAAPRATGVLRSRAFLSSSDAPVAKLEKRRKGKKREILCAANGAIGDRLDDAVSFLPERD